MNNSESKMLAQFTIELYNLKAAIVSVCAKGSQLQCPDVELLQILDLAAQSIEAYLKAYRLEAVRVTKGAE